MVAGGGLTTSREKKRCKRQMIKKKKKRYTHMNSEFQRTARKGKETFLSVLGKEFSFQMMKMFWKWIIVMVTQQ